MEPVPPIRRKPPRVPVEIRFEGASLPPPEEPPYVPPPSGGGAGRNSMYHVQKALVSPRVMAAVVAISGYAWAGAQYIAGTARQTDLDTAELRIDALQKDLQTIKVTADTALSGAQECVKQLGAQALAMRAVVGQIGRQRGRTELQKRNEQAAAESRYNTAILDGKPPHEAARIALYDQ